MQVDSNVIAVSLIKKLQERKVELEKMQLRQLSPELVKEWQRLKLLERELLQ